MKEVMPVRSPVEDEEKIRSAGDFDFTLLVW